MTKQITVNLKFFQLEIQNDLHDFKLYWEMIHDALISYLPKCVVEVIQSFIWGETIIDVVWDQLTRLCLRWLPYEKTAENELEHVGRGYMTTIAKIRTTSTISVTHVVWTDETIVNFVFLQKTFFDDIENHLLKILQEADVTFLMH
jgi:hypothetical protein